MSEGRSALESAVLSGSFRLRPELVRAAIAAELAAGKGLQLDPSSIELEGFDTVRVEYRVNFDRPASVSVDAAAEAARIIGEAASRPDMTLDRLEAQAAVDRAKAEADELARVRRREEREAAAAAGPVDPVDSVDDAAFAAASGASSGPADAAKLTAAVLGEGWSSGR